MGFPNQVEIEVTQEDIDHGIPKCIGACAFARAAHRAFGNRCEVAPSLMYVIPPNADNVQYIMGPASQKFVLRFDEGEEVKPGKFIVKREE